MRPVQVYKEYRSHRPVDLLDNDSRFYLRPLVDPESDIWYSRQAVGKNKLGKMMSVLAEKGDLQGRKVNHSTRKTFATALVQAGWPPTEVAHLGGWKSVQTINQYSTPSLEQQAQASDIISDIMLPSGSTENYVQQNPSTSVKPAANVLSEISPNVNTSNMLDASKSISSNVSKQQSNPFAVLCGEHITGGTFNINIVSGKRKFSDIQYGSQES
ncbi:hypothetical protein ACF0H5_023364 [Mactra antiquata]